MRLGMLRCARLQGRFARPALRCLSIVRDVAERINHPLPEPLADTLPDHNWHAYEERYSAIHRTHKDRPFVVADVIKQRTHERRYEWGTILLQTFRTSPTAVGASLRNMLYTSAIVTPYVAVQWRDSLGALDLPPAVLDCLTHPNLEMAARHASGLAHSCVRSLLDRPLFALVDAVDLGGALLQRRRVSVQ